MVSIKPTVLVTRKLPDAVEERLKKDYNPRGHHTVEIRTQEGFLVLDHFDAFFAGKQPPDLVD